MTKEMTSTRDDRELDALVAERVMGLSLIPRGVAEERNGLITCSPDDGDVLSQSGGVLGLSYFDGDAYFITQFPDNPSRARIYEVPHYSKQIASAMLVVEKMRELRYGVVIQDSCAKLPWYVEFDDGHRDGEAKGESLPRAICEAALAALEVSK